MNERLIGNMEKIRKRTKSWKIQNTKLGNTNEALKKRVNNGWLKLYKIESVMLVAEFH